MLDESELIRRSERKRRKVYDTLNVHMLTDHRYLMGYENCPSTCCSSQPQYQPQAAGGMMSAPQYLELPPATPKPNITQSSSCASPCSQSCAPACQPSCCSGSMGMPMGMPFPQQQPMMPVMPQMPPTPPMQQQQACPQACQPAAPGGCAPQAQCPQRCCQNRRR